ncbi:hypothetical protein MRS76_04650 [Rhizobiaceae bacterium n13]|uniref:Uncharacterized protein n=1 Tax=Ferirhizobium litorale TaxID=2927786 RepID=A0AAE3TZU5_9HYPH|nr:hypothetical protein [Fererhizobium litorale]MDI7861237.1 hypothetical protein [Fererhizobium litorale]MDI7921384.1 hypothetical protein [Fererhizobium litorale]
MSLSAAELAGNPAFASTLQYLARNLRNAYDEGPRLARTLATHQRWMMSQGAYALHLERDREKPSTGLTVARLRDLVVPYGIASRNTVQNFMEELLNYRFARYLPDSMGRRPRPLEPTEVTEAAMQRWFAVNLSALDLLDGGRRFDDLTKMPLAFDRAQPRIARNCIESSGWRDPPPEVALFVWTDAGGLVIDEFVGRLDLEGEEEGRFDLGRVDARRMAEHFMMSRTHLQRLLKKAAERGCMGWSDDKRTRMWLARSFLDAYCVWQAVKFSIIDEAFEWACREMDD